MKKTAIYAAAFLMMGAVGVSSSLTVIGEHFSAFSQTQVASLVTAVCVMVIPVTIATGFLMRFISKKLLLLAGMILFILGGTLPFFLDNFYSIVGMRCIFGAGIGLIQTVDPAVIADSYEGAEKNTVQGTATSFQMIGLIVMSMVGGKLGSMGWNKVFLLHLLGVIPLVIVLVCMPTEKVTKAEADSDQGKAQYPLAGFIWPIICCIFYIVGQTVSVNMSNLLLERQLVTDAAQSATTAGTCLAAFAIGGLIMGFIYGPVNKLLKKWTITLCYVLLAIALALFIAAPNVIGIMLADGLAGFAFSGAMAFIYVESGNAVAPSLAAMALAVMTCLQNVGQFLCPYVVNNVGGWILGENSVNRGAYLFGSVIFVILAILVIFVRTNHTRPS